MPVEKSKLLWIGDDYRSKSGYGRVARELFLHLKNHYTIINYSICCNGISKEYLVIDSRDGTSFGFKKLPLVVDTIKPNIIILINDSKIISGWLEAIKMKCKHKCSILPYVCTEYNGIPDDEIKLYNETTDGLFAMAKFTIDEFIQNGYIHKTMRLSHGYTKNILPMNKQLAKRQLGISEDTFVFFSGSKNQPRKRLDIIIRAFVDFLKNHNNEKVLLMMNCGLVDSGWNLKNLYIRLCKENNIQNIEKHIYFCSSNINDSNKNDDELTIIYNACDVGITTSTGESFGLIPFEQSSLGVPQIIPNWGGIIEAIKYGCIKIEPNDFYVYPVILQSANGEARTVFYKDVMNAMERYYSDPVLYNTHAIKVKKNIENYDWGTIANQLISFINVHDNYNKANTDFLKNLSIYCINLPKNIDRKKHIKDTIIKTNFNNYQFFNGIDGNTIDFNQYKHIFTDNAIQKIYAKDKRYGHDMTFGGAGLILTTLELWKTIDKPTLIIEDDVIFDTNFDVKLYELCLQLPDDWDILYLGYSLYPKINQISKNLWKADKVYGTFGYIIHPKYIKKILDNILPFNYQLDTELYKINKTSNVYVASPPIILHPDIFPSDIQIIA